MTVVAADWWRPLEDEPRLSQGDVLDSVDLALLVHPEAHLVRKDVPGQRGVWVPSEWKPDGTGYCHSLAHGRKTPVVVLTDSCQLDKDTRTKRVIIAPVGFAERTYPDPAQRENMMAGNRPALVPLPAVPGLGDCFADLRVMATVRREAVDRANKIATMTTYARKFLGERIAGFFLREQIEGRDPAGGGDKEV